MDKSFSDKLYNIVINHIADENFGTSNLAELLSLSKSQTLRKVKAATGKSVNQYIREVKLAEAAKLIMETELTSAEIGYKVGFSSPSYFSKTFRKHYGVTPGAYETQESTLNENDFLNESIIVHESAPIQKKSMKVGLILIGSILVLLLATTAYYFNRKEDNKTFAKTSKTIISDKSIAILPFKNLSGNKENQYFADGVMEVILNHLTSINELKVISRTSMEQYRETTKTMPQIAKELGISYILEGSVQKNNDKIRIITQLIDAKNDRHISSTDIQKDYKEIFELQSTIANQISKELNTELSDAERNHIEKKPTHNLEAYSLYLKGLHFIHIGSANESIPYFERAIEKDPEFAFAYSSLAVAYMQLAYRGILSPQESNKKIKRLTQKAIALDSSVGQPHHILALVLFRYDYNWEAAEKEFLISLELDPKDAFTHQLYSKFLNYVGRFEESREQINKAQSLDPVHYVNYYVSAEYYYYAGEYEKALSENQKGAVLTINYTEDSRLNFEIHMAQKNYDKAINELQKIYNGKAADQINAIYKQLGIKGVYDWLINIDSTSENYNTPYYLARKYEFIGEHGKALDQLEKSYEMRVSRLAGILRDPNFTNLRSTPRFKKIVRKMGLDDYKVPH